MLFQVRHIKKGVNPASASDIYFSGHYLSAGIRIGLIAGMVALTVSKFIENSSPYLFNKHTYSTF
jgi:hypothetical protein